MGLTSAQQENRRQTSVSVVEPASGPIFALFFSSCEKDWASISSSSLYVIINSFILQQQQQQQRQMIEERSNHHYQVTLDRSRMNRYRTTRNRTVGDAIKQITPSLRVACLIRGRLDVC